MLKQVNSISINNSKNMMPQRKVSPSFGSGKALATIGKLGNDAGMVTISTTAAVMILRPLVIMADKNATKEEKIYAASWIAALSAVGLAFQAILKKPIDKASIKVAEQTLKLTGKAAQGAAEWVKFALFNVAAVGYTYLNSRYVGRVLDAVSKKITGKPFSKDKKELSPEEKAKDKKIDKAILGAAAAIAGFVGLNFIGRRFFGKPIASETISKGFNAIKTALYKIGPVKSFANTINTKRLGLISKLQKFAQGHEAKLAKDASAGAEWITRNMIANGIVRPTISLLSGQPYVAVRCLIDEGIGILFMKGIGNPLNKTAFKSVIKRIKGPIGAQEKEGVKILTEQLVKNIGVLCIGLGFFNNFFSKKVVALLNKFNKGDKKAEDKKVEANEKEYKEFRKNFIPAAKISEDSTTIKSAQTPDAWLNTINQSGTNEEKFRAFIEQYKAKNS